MGSDAVDTLVATGINLKNVNDVIEELEELLEEQQDIQQMTSEPVRGDIDEPSAQELRNQLQHCTFVTKDDVGLNKMVPGTDNEKVYEMVLIAREELLRRVILFISFTFSNYPCSPDSPALKKFLSIVQLNNIHPNRKHTKVQIMNQAKNVRTQIAPFTGQPNENSIDPDLDFLMSAEEIPRATRLLMIEILNKNCYCVGLNLLKETGMVEETTEQEADQIDVSKLLPAKKDIPTLAYLLKKLPSLGKCCKNPYQ